jgi:hypothetical protein
LISISKSYIIKAHRSLPPQLAKNIELSIGIEGVKYILPSEGLQLAISSLSGVD